MVFVFVFAEAVRGSKRWIDLGPFQFQPSEFGKLFFVLAIAGFLVERGRRVGELGTVATAIGLGLVPMGLVFLQPDLGTALVYGAALTAVLFLSGVRWLHLILLGVSTIVLADERAVAAPGGGRRGAEAVPDSAPDGIHEPRQRSGRADVQRDAVANGGRRGRVSRAAASRERARHASTTFPSTRPTSSSPRSRSSAGSSAPRSCCCSTSSSSGAACASSRSPETSTEPSSRAGSSSRSCSRCSSTSA